MATRSGHGATLGFSTSTGYSPCYTSLGGLNAARAVLDTSCLNTTGASTQRGGDLFRMGENTHSYLLDSDLLATTESNSIDDLLFDSGAAAAAENMTLTIPGGATLVGSAYVVGFEFEDIGTDQLMAASITTAWADWPTITSGS